jgi:glycerophosphoryl diester phosphodiesterase
MEIPAPLILGHRGAPLEATENTLRSLQLALDRGADGVEIDVQRSRDGTPVVVHDPTLERTMGVAGHVAELDWPAIQRLTAARVPSFEQVAAWAAASDAWLNVELKTTGVEREVVRLVRDTGRRARTFLSSFDPTIVRRVVEEAPDVPAFLLTECWDAGARAAFGTSGASGVCLRHEAASAAALDELSAAGVPVVAWTVNSPQRVAELLAAGVAAIISDDPGMAARIARGT